MTSVSTWFSQRWWSFWGMTGTRINLESGKLWFHGIGNSGLFDVTDFCVPDWWEIQPVKILQIPNQGLTCTLQETTLSPRFVDNNLLSVVSPGIVLAESPDPTCPFLWLPDFGSTTQRTPQCSYNHKNPRHACKGLDVPYSTCCWLLYTHCPPVICDTTENGLLLVRWFTC